MMNFNGRTPQKKVGNNERNMFLYTQEKSTLIHTYIYTYGYTLSHLVVYDCNSRDCSPPGSSVHGISQQEYSSVLPFPTSRYLPHPGTEPTYLVLAGGFITTEPPGKPTYTHIYNLKLFSLNTVSFEKKKQENSSN